MHMKSFITKPSPKLVFNLGKYGEVGFILRREKVMKSKINNRGKKGILVGYVKQSTRCTYRIYNLKPNK